MAYRRFAAFRLADTKLGSELRFRCHTYRPLALHAGVRCVHDSANAVLRLLGQHWTESVARRHLISAWGDGRSGGRRMSRSERPPDLAQGARILAAGGAAPLSAGEQRSGWSERRDLNSGPPVPQTRIIHKPECHRLSSTLETLAIWHPSSYGFSPNVT